MKTRFLTVALAGAVATTALAQAPRATPPGTTPSSTGSGATSTSDTTPKVPSMLPTTVQPASSAPKSATSTYRVSPGDQLEVYVWGEEKLQRMLSVLPDGTFAFPLAGTVVAANHTTNEIESELSRLLASQYRGIPPQVTVSVKQPAGMQISVIGKVKAPGTFSPTRYVTVLDALALAGGPSDFADTGNIVILRSAGGKTQVIKAKLAGVLKGRPSGDDLNAGSIPQLAAGDTVVVP